jgi:hypothetical protein
MKKLIILVCLLNISACTAERPKEVTGQFDVIKEFYLFDGSKHGTKGKYIKDRKSGKCYFYMWGGMGNGGPAITNIECKDLTL